MKRYAFSISILLMSLQADDYIPDCTQLKKEYENAMRYVKYSKERMRYSKETLELLRTMHEKCQNEVSTSSLENRTAFALLTYQLARAYAFGNGITKDHPQACKYFNEIVTQFDDIKTEKEIVAWSLHFIGEGALHGSCEKQNHLKAKGYYEEARKKANDPDLIAWSNARLGDIYRQEKGVPQDMDKSVKFFEQILNNAANIPDKSVVAWAAFWIADAYESGKGKPQDLKKAYEIWIGITKKYEKIDPIAVDHANMRLQKMRGAGFVPEQK